MSGNVNQPAFTPVANGTVNLTATTASGRVQVQADQRLARHIRLVNTGTVTVFVEFGSSSVTASTTTSMPIPAGNTEIFSFPAKYCAAITASGTAIIYLSPGEGV